MKYVLLVDDEEAIRALLRDVLEDEDVGIYEAEDGESALDYITSRRIDLVVSDLRMPGMSGVDLLDEIRKRFSSMPVLIITGKPTLDAAVDCMKGGAIDFLTKPFDIMEFREMVQTALADNDRLRREQQESRRYHDLHNLSGYKIEELLGEGTSGVVFRATKGGEEFALKVFKFATISESRREELELRFMRESEFLGSINHPNIVSLHEFGFSDEGIPFIVMEYVNGRTLKKRISCSDMSFADKIAAMYSVAMAVDYIHLHNIIHRDIKPDNIMVVEEDLRIVLTDFGIIRMPDSDLTMMSNIMGSPAYLAPEGFNSANVDERSDIFALGVVLYELLLGRRPFLADDLFSMATMVQTELPPRPKLLMDEFPPVLEELLARSFKKEPANRLRSAKLFADFLKHVMDPNQPKPDLPELGFGPDWSEALEPMDDGTVHTTIGD